MTPPLTLRAVPGHAPTQLRPKRTTGTDPDQIHGGSDDQAVGPMTAHPATQSSPVDTPAFTPRVLVLGFDPYRCPGLGTKPVADGIDVGGVRFIQHGVGAEFCLFGLDGSDDVEAVVTAALCPALGVRRHRWRCAQ